ncbi:hypothetical protein GL50803_0014093 [Giardia duodenalis]|uniref:Uncharacterized protein n=1 Tax=Giardia intestinalis (strain ATCC 50803 / WB clone C6) TaxID=184922 RepID=A8BRC6_GIAIC|nr:hypothetical protein GL50803_0014093 [Giardia intestinalis]KAE8304395.1 hypothetical protein GL50803_0014093 [Giardia intestinalis]|eukprot:XP_001705365.1 Hypothetical protein GL50803_14093 [Giardia lamblia ATCC 50803]
MHYTFLETVNRQMVFYIYIMLDGKLVRSTETKAVLLPKQLSSLSLEMAYLKADEDTIIFKFTQFRGIITETVLYLVQAGLTDDSLKELEACFQVSHRDLVNEPFEVQVLDTIISTATAALRTRLNDINSDFVQIDLANRTKDGVKDLLFQFPDRLLDLSTQCQCISLAISDLLDDEDEIISLCFKNRHFQRDRLYFCKVQKETFNNGNDYLPYPIDTLVNMLEIYLFLTKAMISTVDVMRSNILNTFSLSELDLDKRRNKILRFELHITFVSLAIEIACMFSSLLGMNVYIPNSESVPVFFYTSGGIVAFSVCIILVCLLVERIINRRQVN